MRLNMHEGFFYQNTKVTEDVSKCAPTIYFIITETLISRERWTHVVDKFRA
jgi:hypothetical protein